MNMKKRVQEKLLSSERFFYQGILTEDRIDQAIDKVLRKVEKNILILEDRFPTPATNDNTYLAMDNTEWTNGFWTGILWLCYEVSGKKHFREAAEKNVQSFIYRIENEIEVEHHDLGFLYSLSCVSAYKLTGNDDAKEAAIMAAEKLLKRYQSKGQFIQAWGELGIQDNYRLIVDCLLNIPLLFWATTITKDERYREVAIKHYHTTIENAIREDSSAYHTFFFDAKTGKPLYGKTRQGYSDSSSWARGQSWLIYGLALFRSYCPEEDNTYLFEAITNYFLNRLPKDFVSYWDLIFMDGSEQSRDTSATAIVVCGLNLMDQFLPESNSHKLVYKYAQHSMLRSLLENYTESKTDGITALLNEGVYSWHSGKGVNEGNIWGDYFYLEALVRFKKNWKMYW